MKYRASIDALERLVVMRLFELAKLGMSGTGYKLQQQIAKALQRRSAAIRNAITRYNKEAQALEPPRPTITWNNIVDYSILGEFDLLRQSRTDIRQEEWAKPAHREATLKYFKLCRAREELTRVEVEVCRLRTAIHDEEQAVKRTIERLKQTDTQLAQELDSQYHLRRGVNKLHLWRLDRIEALPGYAGRKGIGQRKETLANDPANDQSIGDSNDPAHADINMGTTDEGTANENHAKTTGQPLNGSAGDIAADIEQEEDTILAQMMADFLNDLDDGLSE